MDKKVLKEYESMRIEVQDTKKRIQDIEQQLQRYEKTYKVKDSVSGGMGGSQHFIVEGFPYPEFERKRTQLMSRKLRYEKLNEQLEEAIEQVEKFIYGIKDSRLRMILKLRYIDGQSWGRVAKILGKGNTADSVRKEHDRFLNK